MADDKKIPAKADAKLETPAESAASASGPVSAEELKARLATLKPPNADRPVWAPPRPEDLVFVEVGPRHQAPDASDYHMLYPGDRGYITKAQLDLHPNGFRKIGADGEPIGPLPVFKLNTMLVETGPVELPEPVFPRAANPNPLTPPA